MKHCKALNIILGITACLCISGVLALCFCSDMLGMFYVKTLGNPDDAVNGFYENAISHNYEQAYRYISADRGIGLENIICDSENPSVEKSLLQSYDYEILEINHPEKLEYVYLVRFYYLDLNAFYASVENDIVAVMEKNVDEMPKAEIYDENSEYLKSFLDLSYEEAVNNNLSHVTDFYTYYDTEVSVEYVGDRWLVCIDNEILKGFSGGK